MKKKVKQKTKPAKSPADFLLPFTNNKHACGCIKAKTKLCKEHDRA